MRKTHWISLAIALVIAGCFVLLESRRIFYFSGTLQEQSANPDDIKKQLDYKPVEWMHHFELFTYDARFKVRGNLKPHKDIAIIAIDDNSLKKLQQWPWPRRFHAKLIQRLQAQPPKALLFDILFIEPFNLDLEGDRELVKVTQKNPWVVHSFYYHPNHGPIGQLELPFKSLREASDQLGYANAIIDEDGVLRHGIPQRRVQDQVINFLALVGASLYLDKPIAEIVEKLPLDASGRITVNYVGRAETFPYYSYAAVLSGTIPASEFADKVVYVGSRATATYDHYPTPLSKVMPGVEFHTNVLNNILQADALKVVGGKNTYLVILFIALLCGLLLPRCSAWVGALVALGIGLLYAVGAQWLFASKHVVIHMAGPLLTLGGGYLAILIYRFFTEEHEKRMVKGFFAQQVSKELLQVLMESPQILKKEGERREMTAFFSDVASFTSISERLQPEELVELLNKYLTAMTNVIFEYGGYLDKYMGDGIMAFWNGLLKQPDHAEKACRCALKSMQRLKELNVALEQRGLVPLKARIGVNTGTMLAGFMGSDQKNQYTIMGDNVNLASRLEGANKAFGTSIMISEFTCDSVNELFEVRFLDIIRVPGKARPVKTYELLGEKGQVDPVWGQVLPLYHEAIQEFGSQQFQSAKRKFLEVLGILGHDKPCETYIQRADAFILNPPPKDWDGVFELKTK
jgi:adenylate cyclase